MSVPEVGCAAEAVAAAGDCVAFRPIGVLRSPHKELKGMPIQPVGARGVAGHIEVAPEFVAGLKDLEGFSHVIILYHLHRTTGFDLLVKPFLDTDDHGVFATRSPKRPNAIGLSVLELAGVDEAGGLVRLLNVDVLDGTPVLDIKPYVPAFDSWQAERIGWFAGKVDAAGSCRADGRFL